MLTDHARHLRPPLARPPAISPFGKAARVPRRMRLRAEEPARLAAKPHGQTLLVRNEKMKRLEAVLFLAKQPLHARKLSQYANLADGTEGLTLIRRLNNLYDKTGRSFRVEEVANGWQLRTRRKFANWLRRLPQVPTELRLSPPAMETLAVVAYRQPVVRAEVETVRGVACGEILRQLMEKELIRVAGRSEELGRPYLYSTTNKFLQVFGLRAIEELPRAAIFQEALMNADTISTEHSSQSSLVHEGEKETAVSIGTSTETVDIEASGQIAPPFVDAPSTDKVQDSRVTRAVDDDELEDEEFEYDDEDDDDELEDDEEFEFVDDDDDDTDEEDDDELDDDEEFDDDDDELEDDEEWEDDDDEWEEVEGKKKTEDDDDDTDEEDDDDEWEDDEVEDDDEWDDDEDELEDDEEFDDDDEED